MDYATLCTNIAEVCENTFEANQLAMFVQQAEQKIYNSVQLPSLRKTAALALTPASNYLAAPADFIAPFSLAIISATGAYTYLINKDPEFLLEAYPNPATQGTPKYYALKGPATGDEEALAFILAPTPSDALAVQLQYFAYPESIVTAGETWLGDQFDSALLNGALIEALRFMKGEADMVAFYEKLYVQAIGLLKNLGDGKLRQDTYRAGQFRIKPQ